MSYNEATQSAETSTGVVTAGALLAVIREGTDSIGLRGYAAPDRASYSDAFIFTVEAHKRVPAGASIRSRQTTTIDVPGYVHGGHTSAREEHVPSDPLSGSYMKYTEGFRPLSGFWYLSFQQDRILDILELLPKAAAVSFEVYLDAGTTENLTRANVPAKYGTEEGLHADHLYLIATYEVRGKQKTRRYLIDATTTPHNTSRFGFKR